LLDRTIVHSIHGKRQLARMTSPSCEGAHDHSRGGCGAGRAPVSSAVVERGRLARVCDAALPLLVTGLYLVMAIDGLTDPVRWGLGVAVVAGVVQGCALWWRWARPEVVLVVVLAAALPYHLLVPDTVAPVAELFALWSLTRLRPPSRSLSGLVAIVAVIAVNFLVDPAGDVLFAMVVAVGVWALAEAARYRRTAISEAARRAVTEEQGRIARELHDVIAHSVSVIVVQAGAANDVFDARPELARAALRSIEATGRETLGELRRLLGAVRVEDDTAPAAPQPGLARIGELAAPLRAAGLDVVVTTVGTPAPLPAGVDLSAYRIVQEALTNTLRHARASVAEVTLRFRPDAVEIEVVDDGRAASLRSTGAGFGVLGMRERVAMLGGTLHAGPTAHGGYRVHASLPLNGVP
jgi:signal transduction histidine kinase